MLQKIIIKNFQSHKNTEMAFCPGVNVIYGVSQSGKTAILRALKLLAYNRPSGAKYYSNFAPAEGVTEIDVQLDNGRIKLVKSVKRGKDGSKILNNTRYEMGGMNFSAGADVPEEIRQLLNLSEINIQNQFDAPFLATSSPGEIARTINRITKLEEVDGWKSELTKRINRTNQEMDILVKQAKQLEIELAKYEGFEDLQNDVDKLNACNSDYGQVCESMKRLDESLVKIEKLKKACDEIQVCLDTLHEYEVLEQEYLVADTAIRKIEGIKYLVEEINEYTSIYGDSARLFDMGVEIDNVGKLAKRVNELDDLQKSANDLLNLLNLLNRAEEINELFQRQSEISERISVINVINADIAQKGEELKEQIDKYITILRRDKKCPICMSPIDITVIKRLQRGLE